MTHHAAAILASGQPRLGRALADWVRYLGVLLGVIGALAVAPNALPVLLRKYSQVGRQRWNSARAVVRRLLKLPRPGGKISILTKKSHLGGTGSVSRPQLTGGEIWSRLNQMEKVINYLQAVQDLHSERIGQLAKSQAQTAAALKQVRQELLDAIDERDQLAERIDADALPLVAAGILIAGIPGELAAWHPLGWASIVVTVWLSFVGGRKSWRTWRPADQAGAAETDEQPAAVG